MDNQQARSQDVGHDPRVEIEALHEGDNNNIYPPISLETTNYNLFDEASRSALLRDKGFLFGVRIDSNDGPRRGLRQVARYGSRSPLPIQEMNNIDSEVVITENSRDTNYIHRGWSLSAISDNSPWTLSRITRNNLQVNPSSRSITKCIIIQKLRIDLSLEDLSPAPELANDFKKALAQPTRFEKSNAVYRAFEHWGDVIPLVFDIGISLAVTDSEAVAKSYLADRSYLGLQKLSISTTARPSTRGGDPSTLRSGDGIKAWLGTPVPPSQWDQVRIIRAVPLTSILSNELQSQLAKLSQSLTTYCPDFKSEATSGGISFDGTSHTLKTVSKVTTYSAGHHVKSIAITYANESSPIKCGAEHQINGEFKLLHGEHITDVFIWRDYDGVCGIQLCTSQGRTSHHFGSTGGSPQIMRSTGGCLAAFSGVIRAGIINNLQTIWRHDVQGSGLSGEREASRYFGGMGGRPFSDWPFVKHSNSAQIASIRVKCGKFIDGIQITYRDASGEDSPATRQANYHGGSGGHERFFHLAPNEHIVTVTGKHKGYIDQLHFVTNTGRTSDVFGGGGGDSFRCEAPKTKDGKATRLHYICGKSAGVLDGILLIWAPV
ncbi:hypothetical protein B0J17DRAFT_680705 [Rhizoctonia solani]|nr:hypothetical protein B0J17DRAFT_680705 [Rhizoctonia solani]